MKQLFTDLIALTKPTILMLVVITGATALIIYGVDQSNLFEFVLILFGLYCTGGSANAFNQYFERNVDSKMERTKKKRPLADRRLNEKAALSFTIILGVLGIALFLIYFNVLSGVLAFATIIFYSFYYTLYLKPRTPQNIVIGGAAGAMGPVIAWAAISGDVMSIVPWSIFAVIFFWTPPHFWALALYSKKDYEKVNYPMMPLTKGDEHTYKLMVFYTVLMILSSFSIILYNPQGFLNSPPLALIYSIGATVLGFYFVKRLYFSMQRKTEKSQRSLFGYSIVYIFFLCFTMMIDAVI
jgi:protoheme IX farnesyltransferase